MQAPDTVLTCEVCHERESMSWALTAVLVAAAVVLIYVIRHLPMAIEQLRRELGE